MINLINGCAEFGLTVDLLIANRNSPHLGKIDPRVNIVEIGEPFFRSCVPKVAGYLKSACPDWVISNREKSHRYLVLARWFAGSNSQLAFRIGNSLAATLKKRNRLKRLLRHQSIRWSYAKADLVIVNSRGLSSDVQNYAGVASWRIRVLNNPTFHEDVLLEARAEVDHPWLADNSVPVILGVGRLTRQKDFPTLIQAFARVARERPARLIILGEGNDRDSLQGLVEQLGLFGRVDLPGYVTNPFAFMARANLFVLSSAWEGSPNVLIQALSVGCPVVATDCPEGPREILRDGRLAPLVAVGDVPGMAAAIRQMLDNPPDRAALRRAAEPFEVKRAVLAYLDALRQAPGIPPGQGSAAA
jgi:glycosyltransferase involved in cell wall biosynthesis